MRTPDGALVRFAPPDDARGRVKEQERAVVGAAGRGRGFRTPPALPAAAVVSAGSPPTARRAGLTDTVRAPVGARLPPLRPHALPVHAAGRLRDDPGVGILAAWRRRRGTAAAHPPAAVRAAGPARAGGSAARAGAVTAAVGALGPDSGEGATSVLALAGLDEGVDGGVGLDTHRAGSPGAAPARATAAVVAALAVLAARYAATVVGGGGPLEGPVGARLGVRVPRNVTHRAAADHEHPDRQGAPRPTSDPKGAAAVERHRARSTSIAVSVHESRDVSRSRGGPPTCSGASGESIAGTLPWCATSSPSSCAAARRSTSRTRGSTRGRWTGLWAVASTRRRRSPTRLAPRWGRPPSPAHREPGWGCARSAGPTGRRWPRRTTRSARPSIAAGATATSDATRAR